LEVDSVLILKNAYFVLLDVVGGPTTIDVRDQKPRTAPHEDTAWSLHRERMVGNAIMLTEHEERGVAFGDNQPPSTRLRRISGRSA
jgi:hypothetical protein